jgi:hypothetical protein
MNFLDFWRESAPVGHLSTPVGTTFVLRPLKRVAALSSVLSKLCIQVSQVTLENNKQMVYDGSG